MSILFGWKKSYYHIPRDTLFRDEMMIWGIIFINFISKHVVGTHKIASLSEARFYPYSTKQNFSRWYFIF